MVTKRNQEFYNELLRKYHAKHINWPVFIGNLLKIGLAGAVSAVIACAVLGAMSAISYLILHTIMPGLTYIETLSVTVLVRVMQLIHFLLTKSKED